MSATGMTPHRILVRAPNWIGDQVMAYPFFVRLREMYPNAHITVVCVPWVEGIQFQGLVNEVIKLPTGKGSALEKFTRMDVAARMLREQGGFDLAYLLPPSFSSAWFAWRAGAKRRVGVSADGRRFLLTEKRDPRLNEGRHRTESYLALLDPTYRFDREQFWEKNKFDPLVQFATKPLIEGENSAYFVLAPGSNAESRRWSEDQFFAVASKVARDLNLSVMLVGGQLERATGERLEHHFKGEGIAVQNRIGQGGLPDLVPILKAAKFFVGNDSGLSHLASLLGVKTYVVWGAGNPAHTAPVGSGAVKLFFEPIDCWPCEKNQCRFEGKEPSRAYQCLRAIDSERVTGEITLDANRS